jgi:hypothetical protein
MTGATPTASIIENNERFIDPDPGADHGPQHTWRFRVQQLRTVDISFNSEENRGLTGPICPICLENFDGVGNAPVKTACKHIMCSICLSKCVSIKPYKNTCPICRVVLFRRSGIHLPPQHEVLHHGIVESIDSAGTPAREHPGNWSSERVEAMDHASIHVRNGAPDAVRQHQERQVDGNDARDPQHPGEVPSRVRVPEVATYEMQAKRERTVIGGERVEMRDTTTAERAPTPPAREPPPLSRRGFVGLRNDDDFVTARMDRKAGVLREPSVSPNPSAVNLVESPPQSHCANPTGGHSGILDAAHSRDDYERRPAPPSSRLQFPEPEPLPVRHLVHTLKHGPRLEEDKQEQNERSTETKRGRFRLRNLLGHKQPGASGVGHQNGQLTSYATSRPTISHPHLARYESPPQNIPTTSMCPLDLHGISSPEHEARHIEAHRQEALHQLEGHAPRLFPYGHLRLSPRLEAEYELETLLWGY